MDERATSMKTARLDKSSSNSRKNKKRGGKKSATRVDGWCNEEQSDMNGGPMLNMEYNPMFWQQSSVPSHMQPPQNGQRLFTAMSDPTVCGYSTVPVAYTMEPVSMPPIYPLYRPVPRPNYRAFRGRTRINVAQNQHVASHVNQQSNIVNGYSSLQDNRSNYLTPSLYQNGDYTSLPPTANNHVVNDTEELNSEHRRYSDPGLGPTDLPPYTNSDESDSGESGSSITTIEKNNKFILTLVEQMTTLREANSQMFRELHETKLSLENMKAELIRVKQYAALDYQPGMLSDIISEMREANKILDETMMTKVNAIVEEKNHQKIMELNEVKARLSKMSEDKADVDKRITKLEEDITGLKLNFSNEDRDIAAFEEEALALRRELQEARASRNYADSHVAKCVDTSVAKSLMPVNLKTPCITSTPVRTDIHDPCHASTAGCQSSSSSSTSSTSSPLLSSSLSNSSRNVKSYDGTEIDEDWQWNMCTKSGLIDSHIESASSSSSSIDEKNHEKPMNHNIQETKKNLDERKESIESIKSMEPDEREALERLIHFHFNREQSLTIIPNSSKQKMENYYHENGGTSNSKKHPNNSYMNSALTTTSTLKNNDIDEKAATVNIDRNSLLSKNLKKDGVVEVPDVVVIAGKSVVPKHLCSTRILTSRILTAPSRATYTTAYI